MKHMIYVVTYHMVWLYISNMAPDDYRFLMCLERPHFIAFGYRACSL